MPITEEMRILAQAHYAGTFNADGLDALGAAFADGGYPRTARAHYLRNQRCKVGAECSTTRMVGSDTHLPLTRNGWIEMALQARENLGGV